MGVVKARVGASDSARELREGFLEEVKPKFSVAGYVVALG